MEESQTRLPMVRPLRYPAPQSPTQALVTTATRGAALMAAGAVARFLLKQAVDRLLAPRPAKPAVTDTALRETDNPSVAVEEVVFYRRTLYRR